MLKKGKKKIKKYLKKIKKALKRSVSAPEPTKKSAKAPAPEPEIKPAPEPVAEPVPELTEEELFLQRESAAEEVYPLLEGKDKEHVWAFCAGQYSQDFRGNPKYLFLYISKYRKDIFAYWYCQNPEVVELIRSMGYHAYYAGTAKAAAAIDCTGVLVAEQVKAEIPAGLEQAKYLNLWHGVGGVKAVERSIKDGLLVPELARKYIRHNEFYQTYELYVAPSSFIESIAKAQVGLREDQIIHAGYPRCLYQRYYDKVETFDHDMFQGRDLPEDTRIAVYIPTRREEENLAFFAQAMPDLDRLVQVCEREHIFFIFKMHPYYENDMAFLQAKTRYQDCPWLLFWDNSLDFYEVIDRVDLCVMDYSSMFTDMIVAGVKHFLRYTFDFDGADLDFPMEYDDITPGRKCETFDELLEGLAGYRDDDIQETLDRIRDLYWEYSTPDSMDVIIEKTIAYQPVKPELPTLHTFDVFDTVFSRKVLAPEGIFYGVREKMEASGGFPQALVRKYPQIRRQTELVTREFFRKTKDIRDSESVEIHFDDIFRRMAAVYDLSQEQTERLKRWEMELELDNVIPLPEQIDRIKQLKAAGETVLLVSDMYLPVDFVRQMLAKADPVLAEIPLFLSNEYGAMKVHRDLYFEVYKSFDPYYNFKKWIHYGDNPGVDQGPARQCGICTRLVERPEFNHIQRAVVRYLDSYDGYLVAAMQSRMCQGMLSERERFVASYVTLLMVPYIDWVLRDAQRRGYRTLYFVSRDGHPLKRIADAIIEERGLDIRTKYIYASRRTWRIPSFIHEIDPCFWEAYANFGDIYSKEKLFRAMSLDEETFERFFPGLELDEFDFEDKEAMRALVDQFKVSEEYKEYLLEVAARERVLAGGYLRQEIDPNEPFAVVEYWGRGYTQDTMVRLWQDIVGQEVDVPFYYSRTVLPTMGSSVRYNFTANSAPQFFIEGLFSNMPYKSVESYEERDGRIEPVIRLINYDHELYEAMQRILPEFAREYAALELSTPEQTDRLLYDAALNYFLDNRTNEEFAEQIGPLVDSVAAFGKKRQFAPALTQEDLDRFADNTLTRGSSMLSTSISMSITRTREDIRNRYFEMYQILPGDNVAGGRLLSPAEQERNRTFKEKYESVKERSELFRELYENAVEETPVTNTVLFVGNGKSFGETHLDAVMDAAAKGTEYTCEALLLGKYSQKKMAAVAAKVAGARFLVVMNSIRLFANVKFRPETKLIMIRNTPVYLYNQALSKRIALKWEDRYNQLVTRNDVSILQVPSEAAAESFRRNFSGHTETDCSLLGCYGTDCYFEEGFAETAREKLFERFPEAREKRIILYMPTLRFRKDFPEWIDMLNLNTLHELLGDEYAIVVNFNTEQKNDALNDHKNILEIPGFSKEINTSREFTIREMLCAADVVVGDYRNSFFETAILHKPAYSTAWDYEEIIKSPNMTNNARSFEKFFFCPSVRSAKDLAEQLKHVDEFDYSQMEEFRELMLAGCDGHSVDRLIQYLKDNWVEIEPEAVEEETAEEDGSDSGAEDQTPAV